MPDGAEVQPDLMLAAGLELQLKQRSALMSLDDPIVSDGAASRFVIIPRDTSASALVLVRDGEIDGARSLRRNALDESEVPSREGVTPEGGTPGRVAGGSESDGHETGGPAIETMQRPGIGARATEPLKIPPHARQHAIIT